MAETTAQQALAAAVHHHQNGRLAEAESLYRQVLRFQSDNVDALHLLGVLAGQTNRHDIAVDLISRAIAILPNNSKAHNNLGNSL
jgi:Flp pilus assembly protein TadD